MLSRSKKLDEKLQSLLEFLMMKAWQTSIKENTQQNEEKRNKDIRPKSKPKKTKPKVGH
jgi:hypothetical protein